MAHRLVLLAVLGLLAAPASASADLIETTPLDVEERRCVRATGLPGELATPAGESVELLRAGRDGLSLAAKVAAPLSLSGCPAVAARPNGAGVLVVPEREGLVAALREPGGGWSTAQPIATITPGWEQTGIVEASVSDRGDAIVAWFETTDTQTRLRVVRRASGEAFGPVEDVDTDVGAPEALAVGAAATGETFLLWSLVQGDLPFRVPTQSAIAPADGPFGVHSFMGNLPWRSSAALAVAQDGRALVAIPERGVLRVSERAPGLTAFDSVGQPLADYEDDIGVRTRGVIDSGGRAAVAWSGIGGSGMHIATRAATRPFTPATLIPGQASRSDPFYGSATYHAATLFSLFLSTDWTLQLTPTGRAVVGTARYRIRRGVPVGSPTLFSVPLGTPAVAATAVDPPFREPTNVGALVLADGSPAAIWTTTGTWVRDDRLHLAADGATPPAAQPTPRVTIEPPLDRVLERFDYLKLPLRCSAACEVRVDVLGTLARESVRFPRAVRGQLTIRPQSAPLAPLREGPVRLRVTYGAPDAPRPRTRTLTVRLRRPADPPKPVPVDLQAVRDGDRVRVTWRTSQPTPRTLDEHVNYWVTGDTTRGWSGEPNQVDVVSNKRRQKTFSVTLPAGGVDYVTVRTDWVGRELQYRHTVKVR
ncbi:hypothetical protein OJ998_23920 [Solirubrobacter taibaiensis]|nr:hypothetical protein [Solirubrobacter taibaiensis]